MRGGTNAQKKVNVSTTTTGSGNAVTAITSSNESISVTKGITAVTTVTTTGLGNVVTSITQDGASVTVTKDAELHKITISTSAPSGGSNGDIWIQY